MTARIRLRGIATRYITVDYRKAPDLDSALGLFDEGDEYPYSVAWIDCLAKGRSLGRSIMMFGDHASGDRVKDDNLERRTGRPRLSVPFDAPSVALNRLSVQTFNTLYYALHRTRDDALVTVDQFFFPLDGVRHWNRLYGRRGFVQYQAVLPLDAGVEGVRTLLEGLAASGMSSFLAVLKRMGPEGRGHLSFPVEGYTLALDIPRRRGLGKLLGTLDRVVLNHGGRIYLAKDASLVAGAFRQMYPRLPRFQSVKDAIDPAGRFASSQSRRLGITESHGEEGEGR